PPEAQTLASRRGRRPRRWFQETSEETCVRSWFRMLLDGRHRLRNESACGTSEQTGARLGREVASPSGGDGECVIGDRRTDRPLIVGSAGPQSVEKQALVLRVGGVHSLCGWDTIHKRHFR